MFPIFLKLEIEHHGARIDAYIDFTKVTHYHKHSFVDVIIGTNDRTYIALDTTIEEIYKAYQEKVATLFDPSV